MFLTHKKQIKADYAKYYKHALLYLACVNIDDLSVAEKASRANDLALSALLGDSIYNFGELVRDCRAFFLLFVCPLGRGI